MQPSDRIERYSFKERAIHWLVALCFSYAALTGLALWSPNLYWITSIFGGGETVRVWHPWVSVVFSVAFALLFVLWVKHMRISRDDRRWLRQAHRYARHDETGLPEAGRFNAGQKLLFWVQSISLLVLLASGLALWFPEQTSNDLRGVAILLHSGTAIVSIFFILVHIYMGTAATPGSFRAMIRGWVTPEWAAKHHPRWSREITKN